VFVSPSGEAVENCVKIARAHTGRRGVIAFNGGFPLAAIVGKADIMDAPYRVVWEEPMVDHRLAALPPWLSLMSLLSRGWFC